MSEGSSVTVNGQPRAVAGRSVLDLVVELDLPPDGRGVAVAIDGEIAPRAGWTDRVLHPGERVEVLTAMQGG